MIKLIFHWEVQVSRACQSTAVNMSAQYIAEWGARSLWTVPIGLMWVRQCLLALVQDKASEPVHHLLGCHFVRGHL